MKFFETPLKGAYLIDQEFKTDERGFFSRVYCEEEYQNYHIESNFVQINNSLSHLKGTLRGLHYQLPPYQEAKIVRCIKGAMFDVIVDLRKDSQTFLKWYAAELTSENRLQMYVPKGFAHGFLTLEDNTEAFYLTSEFYNHECERGIRYNDPVINITWPLIPSVVSKKDAELAEFNAEYHLREL